MSTKAKRAEKLQSRERQRRFKERQKAGGKRQWTVWATPEEVEVYEEIREIMPGLLERKRLKKQQQEIVTSNASNNEQNDGQGRY